MAKVNASSVIQEQKCDAIAPKVSEGSLKIGGKEYSIFSYQDTHNVSQGAYHLITDINLQEMPQECHFEAVWITPEEIQNFLEIFSFLQELACLSSLKSEMPIVSLEEKPTPEGEHVSSSGNKMPTPLTQQTTRPTSTPLPSGELSSKASHPSEGSKEKETVYSSLFSLARAVHQSKKPQKEHSPSSAHAKNSFVETTKQSEQSQKGQWKQEGQEKDKGRQNKDQSEDQEKREGYFQGETKKRDPQKKIASGWNASVKGVQWKKRSFSSSASFSEKGAPQSSPTHHVSVDNIFIRFMALMARILGQAEAEAHELYLRIKQRTDNVDTLTLLISKINSTNGKIDWTQDEEIKQLLEKVRSIGVDIPEGKLTWSEEEKRLLKENIQMKKDSMEKMTQLERTDMQRFLQEASQCHQARSNVLKLLKEVMDTIIANMRP
jgi:beta-galactosidase beta subunit